MGERPRFLADEMLGSLAKWLRIMGYDTIYVKDADDRSIACRAAEEGRALLTRDKGLARAVGGSGLYIVSDVLDEQLVQVAGAFGLRFDEAVTRCPLCNGTLRPVPPQDVVEDVPEGSRRTSGRFFRCAGCSKAYWDGTHWDDIKARLKGLGL